MSDPVKTTPGMDAAREASEWLRKITPILEALDRNKTPLSAEEAMAFDITENILGTAKVVADMAESNEATIAVGLLMAIPYEALYRLFAQFRRWERSITDGHIEISPDVTVGVEED